VYLILFHIKYFSVCTVYLFILQETGTRFLSPYVHVFRHTHFCLFLVYLIIFCVKHFSVCTVYLFILRRARCQISVRLSIQQGTGTRFFSPMYCLCKSFLSFCLISVYFAASRVSHFCTERDPNFLWGGYD